MQPVPVLPPNLPVSGLFLDLFIHESIQSFHRDDPEDTFLLIESFGKSLGSSLATHHLKSNSVPSLPAALHALARVIWPKIFGHVAEISDHTPFIFEDADFPLFRRHREISDLHSEISVFALSLVQGFLQFPCSVRLEPLVARLRLVIF